MLVKHARETARPKKKGARTLVLTILILLIAGFIFGAFMTTKTFITAQREAKTFRELIELVDEDNDEVDEQTGALRKYDELYKRNPDFFGWLKIEDTVIDYPVMYVPGDNDYYLHCDFYGDYSESGTLFLDGDCPSDGSTALIYGHHMKNGSMFGELPKYCDPKFYEKHKVIWFDTRFEQRDYEIVAVFYSEVYDVKDEYLHYCYYNHKDLSDEYEFNEYISFAKANALYDTGITPQYGERILTLSTCNYHTEDGRLVIVAREVPKTQDKNAE